jgi:3-isopropylmalate/(R)-2-methylmalate dehydratase large subunit
MVLATQCMQSKKPKKMHTNGKLSKVLGQRCGTLYNLSINNFRRYRLFCRICRRCFEDMSMEGHDGNLSIEMGARGGMIAQTKKTFDFLEGRLYAPGKAWTKAVAYWKTLKPMLMFLMK